MTGIILLLVTGLWLYFVFWLTKVITKNFLTKWVMPSRILLSLAILPVPLIDEIIGGRQFEQLCKENSTIQVDRVKAAGKTVYLADRPDMAIEGTWVPIRMQPWTFVDATTGETVVSFNTLIAGGGRFIRTLGISEGGVPLTFRSTCVPENRPLTVEGFQELGINYIEPPIKKMEQRNDIDP
jgi:hypothetical protein